MTKIFKRLKVFVLYYLKFYIASLLLSLILVTGYTLFEMNHLEFDRMISFLFETYSVLLSNDDFWILLIIVSFVLMYINSIIRDFKSSWRKGLFNGVIVKLVLPFVFILSAVLIINNDKNAENFEYEWDYSVENKTKKSQGFYLKDGKQRGIHFNADISKISDLEYLITQNFEWITIVPFIYQDQARTPSINPLSKIELEVVSEHYSKLKTNADRLGLNMMLKPHIWLKTNNKSRANISMTSSEDWDTWFHQYETILMSYAQIAEDLSIEQFCIGTELQGTVMRHPEKWVDLIDKIRAFYSGKLVYAANWNSEFEEVSFWHKLDYIGIQAYFPLSNNSNFSEETLLKSWQNHVTKISELSKVFQKPVLFTELGYRSIVGTSKKPWKWVTVSDYFSGISKKEQYLCYEAFFKTVWEQEWFAGVHIWQWTQDSDNGNNTSFSVRDKPALNLIAKEFGIK